MYAFLTAVSDPSGAPASQLERLQLSHREDEDEFSSFAHPSLSKHFTLFRGSAPGLKNLAGWLASAPSRLSLELAFHPEDVRPSWTEFATILRGAPALENLGLPEPRRLARQSPLSSQASLSLVAGRSRSVRSGSKDKDAFAESNSDMLPVCVLIAMPDVSAPVHRLSMHTSNEASPPATRKQVARTSSLVPWRSERSGYAMILAEISGENLDGPHLLILFIYYGTLNSRAVNP
ncbi:hypothetical protein BU15DRAFT_84333 [Melanogaster broomeanus]|nr:hypothetical protein BU15DRAFT_84333 [Melanogaster broomeanus]